MQKRFWLISCFACLFENLLIPVRSVVDASPFSKQLERSSYLHKQILATK